MNFNRKHYQASVVLDSICRGYRLSTLRVTYPRFVHAQLLTHRQFSRSSASSRAIPVSRNLQAVKADPVLPLRWGKNQKGMQAYEELSDNDRALVEEAWKTAAQNAYEIAYGLNERGLHKQLTNRLLEPFLPITVLISATEWGNYLALRCAEDVQDEHEVIAWLMLKALVNSEPTLVPDGCWHIPYGQQYLSEGLSLEQVLKISVARCARISYMNFKGEIDHEDDYRLYDQLLRDKHMGPFEHQGRALGKGQPSGNFIGWLQYRKTILGECRRVNMKELWAKRPEWLNQDEG